MSQKKAVFPRQLAVRVLTRVLSDNQPLDEAMAQMAPEVPESSMGWLQDVCSGTLRWKGRLDSILDTVALRKKPSGWLRKMLLVASYQLLVQEKTHPGAVVSETVTEIKLREGDAPAKFANACLRKVADHAEEWRKQEFPSQEADEVQARWASLPSWLWPKLLKEQGLEWARSYALSSLERPSTWVRSSDPKWVPSWAESGPVPGSWKVVEGGPIPEKEGFSDGKFIVQDISSQFLIHEVTSEIRKLKGDTPLRILDLCAAPGGKSVGMAWNGFEVIATDHNRNRFSLLQQTVSRAAPRVQLLEWDQVQTVGRVDAVWLDAPCTGTGILRRHPDVRWLKKEKDLQSLIQVQEELFKKACELVRPGGVLVYSVCSVLKEEGPGLLARMGFQDRILKSWFLSPQTAPHGDGFWGALIRVS